MTTIAFDSQLGEIAADSQETWGSGHKYKCRKLYRVGDYIVATAGGSYAGMAFVRWLENWEGEPDWDDHPDFINLDLDEDFECLVINPDKTCVTVNRLFIPVEATDRYICLGSGGKAAAGAMFAGATPKEAVRIASKIDTYTGGKICVMTIE